MALVAQNSLLHVGAGTRAEAIAILGMLTLLNMITLIPLSTKYLESKIKLVHQVVPLVLQEPIHFVLPEQKYLIPQIRVQVAEI